VFRPSPDTQVHRAFLSMALLAAGVFGAYWALTRAALAGAALTGAGLIGAAVSGMAALPAFQGYLELTGEALIAYATFGLRAPRVYRLDEICEVHWRPRWGGHAAAVQIMIDYYRRDSTGGLDVRRFGSAWLAPVENPTELYRALRTRCSGRKRAETRPTWMAVVVSARRAIVVAVGLIAFVAVIILWAGSQV
jgi:hypothetical protein